MLVPAQRSAVSASKATAAPRRYVEAAAMRVAGSRASASGCGCRKTSTCLGFGGDREPGRHRHADAHHVREAGALAAEQAAHVIPGAGVGFCLV